MSSPHRLLERLEALGAVLEADGRALALLALGSVGRERERLDAFSDLDFFAIVRPGAKAAFLEALGWLAAAHPIAWAYRNTIDGYKALFADGIFCELAVFEPRELASIPFAPGRIVWQAADFDPSVCTPAPRTPASHDAGWLLGEALSNLLVGLGRWQRGEHVAGFRLVQVHAVDRVLELLEHLEPAEPGVPRDLFAIERRFERRHPSIAAELPSFMPGVERTPEAARALLAFLERRAGVPQAMKAAILGLLEREPVTPG